MSDAREYRTKTTNMEYPVASLYDALRALLQYLRRLCAQTGREYIPRIGLSILAVRNAQGPFTETSLPGKNPSFEVSCFLNEVRNHLFARIFVANRQKI
jgi:hypothetical protein